MGTPVDGVGVVSSGNPFEAWDAWVEGDDFRYIYCPCIYTVMLIMHMYVYMYRQNQLRYGTFLRGIAE